ncbi:MAG: ARMT1-like domain-containing protein [Candidatus Omnitrophota bacterium]
MRNTIIIILIIILVCPQQALGLRPMSYEISIPKNIPLGSQKREEIFNTLLSQLTGDSKKVLNFSLPEPGWESHIAYESSDAERHGFVVRTKTFRITDSKKPDIVAQERLVYIIVEHSTLGDCLSKGIEETWIINPKGIVFKADGTPVPMEFLPRQRTPGDAEGTLAREKDLPGKAKAIGKIDGIGAAFKGEGLLEILNKANRLTPERKSNLEKLRDSVMNSGLIPRPDEVSEKPIDQIPYAESWAKQVSKFFGQSWVNDKFPLMHAASYFEYLKMVAAGYFDDPQGKRFDPFSGKKADNLSSEALEELNANLADVDFDAKPTIEQIANSLRGVMFGNSVDLNWAHKLYKPEIIVADDSEEIAQFYVNEPLDRPIGIFMDNTGPELLNVLALSVLLARARQTDKLNAPVVKLYTKPFPTFVSDVTLSDIDATAKALEQSEFKTLQKLAEEFTKLRNSGQIQVISDNIFTASGMYPADLREGDPIKTELTSNLSNIFVGDVYYRVITSDREYLFEVDISQVIPSWLGHVVILRATKSEVCLVGTKKERLLKALNAGPKAFFEGKVGMVVSAGSYSPIKALLLDFQGTLVPDLRAVFSFKALAWSYCKYVMEADPDTNPDAFSQAIKKIEEEKQNYIKETNKQQVPVSDIRDRLKITPEQQREGKKALGEKELKKHLKPNYQVIETLRRLQKKYRFVIVTNDDYETTMLWIKLAELNDFFEDEYIITQDRAGVKKPDTGIYQKGLDALKKFGITAKQCISIGDMPDQDGVPAVILGAYYIEMKNQTDFAENVEKAISRIEASIEAQFKSISVEIHNTEAAIRSAA